MPLSYHFFKVASFPPQPAFETEEQLTLFDNDEQNMEVVSTRVTFVKAIEAHSLKKFDVMHDFLVKLKYPARARKVTFREYVSPYSFPVYLQEGSGEPDINLLVQTKSAVAKDFVERLNGRLPTFSVRSISVDFDILRPLIPSVSGAWFSEMQASNLSSAGVFGSHVDKSNEFQHAELIGKLKALICPYVIEGVTFTVMITEDAGVVMYNNFETEIDSLSVVMDLKRNLLDKATRKEASHS